jgi:hypothetical protein
VIAEPPDVEGFDETAQRELAPTHVKKRDFMAALFQQARDEGIDSPFRDRAPSIYGIMHSPARGSGLVYRIAVTRDQSRVVLTNASGRWQGALEALTARRAEIDVDFQVAGLPKMLEWPSQVAAGRWAIRYTVDANYRGEADATKMRELNRAAAAMTQVFGPHLQQLDPYLEGDSSEVAGDVVEDE